MAEALLSCRRLRCGYAPGRPVVGPVDLEVERGEIVTILGGSGSGKSTLLRTLAGMLPPLEGEVRLFGKHMARIHRSERAVLSQRTGVVFQHDALLGSLSLIENVALPVREVTELPDDLALELAWAKLSSVGIGQLAHRRPNEISGGQRKRAAIARALVLDPELLFCDEPTSGLDPAMAAMIDHTLLRLRDSSAVAIVAVTHDIDSIRAIADRALVLGKGRVLASDRVERLEQSTQPDVYALFHRSATGLVAPG